MLLLFVRFMWICLLFISLFKRNARMTTPGICHKWKTQCHLHLKIVGLKSGEGSQHPFEAMNIVQTLSAWNFSSSTDTDSCRGYCDILSWFIHSVTHKMWGNFYHSVSLFAISEAQMTPNPSEFFFLASEYHQMVWKTSKMINTEVSSLKNIIWIKQF